jgi:hypothetical protein
MKRVLLVLALIWLCGTLSVWAGSAQPSAPATGGTSKSSSSEYIALAEKQRAETHERNMALMQRSDELLSRQEADLHRAEAAMSRQEADLARQERNIERYEKVLATWERQQAQYQRYLDSLGKK